MVTLEIVKRLTEGNIYFSAYNAMLSTSDHSRHYPLNIQTAVCCFRKQIWAECGESLSRFTTRRDGPAWQSQGLSSAPGRSRC